MKCPRCKSEDIWTDMHNWAGRCRSCSYDASAYDFELESKKDSEAERDSHV
jgi:hypothetical protein